MTHKMIDIECMLFFPMFDEKVTLYQNFHNEFKGQSNIVRFFHLFIQDTYFSKKPILFPNILLQHNFERLRDSSESQGFLCFSSAPWIF